MPNLQLTAGNTASKAANLFNPEGAFDANAFKASIPEVKIPGAIGSGSFGQDLSLGLTNAIASAVPSLGTVEVDFKSIEGQLAIIGSNLQSDFGSALGEKEIPDILDKTEELKTQVVSVAENIITPSGVA